MTKANADERETCMGWENTGEGEVDIIAENAGKGVADIITENAHRNVTYILECADGSYYCGWTNDIEKRVATHNAGKGGKYTRTRTPVRLVYLESFATKEEAMAREWHIKHLSRGQKEELVRTFEGQKAEQAAGGEKSERMCAGEQKPERTAAGEEL